MNAHYLTIFSRFMALLVLGASLGGCTGLMGMQQFQQNLQSLYNGLQHPLATAIMGCWAGIIFCQFEPQAGSTLVSGMKWAGNKWWESSNSVKIGSSIVTLIVYYFLKEHLKKSYNAYINKPTFQPGNYTTSQKIGAWIQNLPLT